MHRRNRKPKFFLDTFLIPYRWVEFVNNTKIVKILRNLSTSLPLDWFVFLLSGKRVTKMPDYLESFYLIVSSGLNAVYYSMNELDGRFLTGHPQVNLIFGYLPTNIKIFTRVSNHLKQTYYPVLKRTGFLFELQKNGSRNHPSLSIDGLRLKVIEIQ